MGCYQAIEIGVMDIFSGKFIQKYYFFSVQ